MDAEARRIGLEIANTINPVDGWRSALALKIADALAQAGRERDNAEERVLESSLVSGCIRVVAELNRKYGATSYADAVQVVDKMAEEIVRLRELANIHLPHKGTCGFITVGGATCDCGALDGR